MQAEILSVGTELLLGQVANTNAQVLARCLAAWGIPLYRQVAVGDNPQRLARAFSEAWQQAELVLVTGGLGPTQDDLTKETVAQALGLELAEDPSVRASIEAYFSRRGLPMPASCLKQALVPRGARVLANPLGTAPGLILEQGGRAAVLLPGPPEELGALLRQVEDYISRLAGQGVILSRVLKVVGLGESVVEARVMDLIQAQTNPTLAPLAFPGEVHLRITARAASRVQAAALLDPLEAEIRSRLGSLVFGADEETLEGAVGELLRGRGLTLAVAESCTAGLVAARLTSVPGASAYFLLGVSTYSDRCKSEVLGVPEEVLRRHGAVSREVAEAMAHGVSYRAKSDLGLAVTGIAGPSGGSPEKPVGTVFLAACGRRGVVGEHHLLAGDRAGVRQRAAQAALVLLRRSLLEGRIA
ncbi:MAG: competence/damage-inducible protein A [Acetobacteraceae bacterium]|nr:competence/damage-inducible protein A [Acetobacteraceae bacterium]